MKETTPQLRICIKGLEIRASDAFEIRVTVPADSSAAMTLRPGVTEVEIESVLIVKSTTPRGAEAPL